MTHAGIAATIFAISLAGCATGKPSALAGRAAEGVQPAAEQKSAPAAPAPSTPDPQLARGRELFLAKCGSCHDADGSKPLRHGPPLNRRALSDEVIAREVAPRLRAYSDGDKQAVAAWIRSFLHPPAN